MNEHFGILEGFLENLGAVSVGHTFKLKLGPLESKNQEVCDFHGTIPRTF